MRKLIFILPILLCSNFVFGQFGPQQLLVAETNYAESAYTADLDGDGDMDVLTASWTNYKIAWYENLGGGVFGYEKVISPKDSAGYNPSYSFVYASDLDGDGDMDVLSAASTSVLWYENLGGGEFGNQQVITTNANYTRSIYTSDLDGDGDMDVLSASCQDDKIAWYENQGGGIFGGQQVITINADYARSVYTSDLDGDGDMDVLSASDYDNKIAWYENQGGGVIDTTQQIITTDVVYAESVYASDLDSDGDMDILSASFYDDKVAWYENMGGGVIDTIQQIITTNADGANTVITSDIDNDGDMDVLSASQNDDKVAWYENMGGGVFGAQQIITTSAIGVTFVHVSDIDGDGDVDILPISSSEGMVGWCENTGGGVFASKEYLHKIAAGVRAVYSTDLDGDGDMDVLSASYSDDKVAWYENLGGGMIGSQQVITTNADGAYSVYASDLDGDGDEDVLSASFNDDKVAWYENQGGGVFGSVQVITSLADEARSVYASDIDGDGDMDVLSASGANDLIAWYENLGGGTFGSLQVITNSADEARSVYASDMDGDGDMDVLSASQNDDKIAWYENMGGGVFGSQQIITTSADGANFVYSVDVDGDGDMDVLSASYIDDKVAWYENTGAGVFGPQQVITTSANGVYSAYASDIDKDGDIDVLSASIYGIKWYENTGGEVFGWQQKIDSYLSAKSVYTSDLDGDGDMDVLVTSDTDGKLAWHENYLYYPRQATGQLYIDYNQDGIKDTNETGSSTFSVLSTPAYDYAYTYSTGDYFISFEDTSIVYQIYPQVPQYWKITSDSLVYHVNIDSNLIFIDSLDFGLYPDSLVDITNAEIIGGFPRCNDTINYWLDVKNTGTTTPSGVIHLQLDDSISYVTSAIPPDSINGQDLYWHYDSLFYFSHEQINLQILMPDFNSIGDTLASYLNVSVIDSLGNQTYLASDTLNPILVCAYDPNDKIADPVGIDSLGYISPNTNHIEYTIRFQNTGNDTALTVVIKDQLDTNLQWQTLVPLASSHPMDINIYQNGEVVFTFNNIMLPDSGADFFGSQGFVKYKIDLKQGLASGTSIFNTANIYFDQNPAVITNTKINTIYNCNGFVQNTISNFNVCQKDTITGSVIDDLSTTEFSWDIPNVYNSTGANFQWVADTSGTFNLTLSTSNSICEKDTTISITVNSLPNVTLANFNPDTLCDNGTPVVLPTGTPSGGNYLGTGVGGGNFDPATAGVGNHQVIYTYTDANSCINSDTTIVTVEVCTGIDNVPNDFGILIYPNPNTGLFTIEKPNGLQEVVQVKLLDATSKLIIDKLIPVGKQKLEMDITNYSNGVYYLQLIVREEVFVKQILKD